jgi:hypothetical protein
MKIGYGWVGNYQFCVIIILSLPIGANILGIVLVTLNECPMKFSRAFLLGGFVCKDKS